MTIVGANKEIFGQAEDGQSVYRVTLTGGGLTANILTWGAILQDLRLEGHQPPLVLGFDKSKAAGGGIEWSAGAFFGFGSSSMGALR